MIRLLTQSDKSDCMNTIGYNTTKRKLYLPSDLLIDNYFNDEMFSYKVFGYCIDKLLAVQFVRYSVQEREYIIDYCASSSMNSTSIIFELLSYVMTYSENCGFYRFIVRFFNEDDRVWSRFAAIHRFDPINKYAAYTETNIPARKKSSFTKYWTQYQQTVMFPSPCKIKIYMLSEKFRTNNDC